jgi:hypothetical protein
MTTKQTTSAKPSSGPITTNVNYFISSAYLEPVANLALQGTPVGLEATLLPPADQLQTWQLEAIPGAPDQFKIKNFNGAEIVFLLLNGEQVYTTQDPNQATVFYIQGQEDTFVEIGALANFLTAPDHIGEAVAAKPKRPPGGNSQKWKFIKNMDDPKGQ